MTILRVATENLRNLASPASLRAISVVALVEAVDQGFPLPGDVAETLWSSLKTSPEAAWAFAAAGAIGRVASDSLVSEILVCLLDSRSGRALRAVTLAVLNEVHAVRHLDDDALVELGSMLGGTPLVFAMANVISVRARCRSISKHALQCLVERWGASCDVATRAASIDLRVLRGGTSGEDVLRLLNDADPQVRSTAATMITDLLDAQVAIEVLKKALEHEVLPSLRSALLSELSVLEAADTSGEYF